MANQNANTINIPIAAPLNLNSNKAMINSDFNGFNKNNSPVIGGCLQPFYITKSEKSNIVYDEDGNYYHVDDEGNVYKNETVINKVNTQKLVRTKLSNDAIDNDWSFAYDDDDILAYMDDSGNCYYDGAVIAKHEGTIRNSIVWFDRNPWPNNEYWCSNELLYTRVSGKDTERYPTTSRHWIENQGIFFVSATSSGAYYNTITITYLNLKTKEIFTTTENVLEEKEEIANEIKSVSWGQTPDLRFVLLDGGVPIVGYRINIHKMYHKFYLNHYYKNEYSFNTKTLFMNDFCGAPIWNSSLYNLNKTYNGYVGYAGMDTNTNYENYRDSYVYSRKAKTISGINGNSFYTPCGGIFVPEDDDGSTEYIQMELHYCNNSSSPYPLYTVVANNSDGFATSYLGKRYYTKDDGYVEAIAANGDLGTSSQKYYYESKYNLKAFTQTCKDSEYNISQSDAGYCINVSDNIRLLYNSNQLSGISWFNGERNVGTLMTPWFHVDKINTILTKGIIYKDTDGNYYKLGVEDGNSLSIIADRYLVVNTTSVKNFYDIQTKKWSQYASDWNNRVAYLGELYGTPSTSATSYYVGSGISIHYEIDGNYAPSAEFPIVRLWDNSLSSSKYLLCAEGSLDGIEYYTNGGSGTTFSYLKTYIENNEWETDSELSGQVYPVQSDGSTYINPSLFATYVESFFNKDFLKDGGSIYSLTYYNSTIPVLIVKDTTEIENIDNFFVISGQYYAIANRFIYNATYDTTDGSISTVDPIVKIDNMRFIGNTPATAFFYSDITKNIYVFQGDRTLTPLTSANGIETINTYCWDSTTQTLFFICENSVYAITSTPEGTGWYKLNIEDATSFKSTDLGVIEVITANGNYELSTSYLEGAEALPLELETQYYGIGNDKIGIIDCFYIKFYNQGTAYSGDVVLGVNTLTDKGTESSKETIHINKDDWDKITGTYLYRYQPEYQRGLGTSLYIKSDFPIYEIVASVSEDTAKQLTKKVDNRTNGGFYQ